MQNGFGAFVSPISDARCAVSKHLCIHIKVIRSRAMNDGPLAIEDSFQLNQLPRAISHDRTRGGLLLRGWNTCKWVRRPSRKVADYSYVGMCDIDIHEATAGQRLQAKMRRRYVLICLDPTL